MTATDGVASAGWFTEHRMPDAGFRGRDPGQRWHGGGGPMSERSGSRARLAERLAVYLVADPEQTERDLAEDAAAALAAGVTCVQLRAKRLGGHDTWRL